MKRILFISVFCFQLSAFSQPGFGPDDLAMLKPAAASAGETLLLDATTNTAVAAYSVSRKLRAAYSGNAFKVRRSSDNATQDIGFVGNNVDTNSLTAFVGGDSAFVQVLYDQTANARNLTNNATGGEPRIVNAGTVDLGSDGYPTMVFDGSDDWLHVAYTRTLPNGTFVVLNHVTFTSNDIILFTANTIMAIKQLATIPTVRINSGADLNNGDTLATGTWMVLFAHFEAGTSDGIRVNAGTMTTGSAGDNFNAAQLQIGSATACPSMKMAEAVSYSGAIGTTDETTIRNNINARYSLF